MIHKKSDEESFVLCHKFCDNSKRYYNIKSQMLWLLSKSQLSWPIERINQISSRERNKIEERERGRGLVFYIGERERGEKKMIFWGKKKREKVKDFFIFLFIYFGKQIDNGSLWINKIFSLFGPKKCPKFGFRIVRKKMVLKKSK